MMSFSISTAECVNEIISIHEDKREWMLHFLFNAMTGCLSFCSNCHVDSSIWVIMVNRQEWWGQHLRVVTFQNGQEQKCQGFSCWGNHQWLSKTFWGKLASNSYGRVIQSQEDMLKLWLQRQGLSKFRYMCGTCNGI